MNIRRGLSVGAASLMGATTLAALSSGGNIAGASSPNRAHAQLAPDTTHLKKGGTLSIGAAQGIPQLNPALWTFAWEETLLPLLWDGLTQYEQNGTVGPDLATHWSSADGARQWTFHLRGNVKFSNGKPFTSANVVSNFNYFRAPATTYHDKSNLSLITSVIASGPRTVVINLSAPDAVLPQGITNVKMIYLPALSTIDSKPIGTGPFVVKSFQPNSQLTLVRNSRYWGTPALLNQIDVVNAPDPTSAYTSLISGSLDLLWSAPYSDVAGIRHSPSLKLLAPKVASQFNFWDLDTAAPPFNNVKVRQALAYAVDRSAILKDAYFGQGLVSNANDPLATNNPAYDKSLKPYPYDLKKAKALFNADRVKSLTWWGIAGQYPEFTTTGEILQASLKSIGVKLNIDNVDISTWAAKFYPAGKKFPGLVVPNFDPAPPAPAFSLNYLREGTCNCNWVNPTYGPLI